MTKQYALYKGEECLFVGNVYQCAAFRGVTVGTIQHWATPAHHKRAENGRTKSGGPSQRTIAIRLEDEDE